MSLSAERRSVGAWLALCRLQAGLAALALSAVAGLAVAQPSGTTESKTKDARTWLMHIHEAALKNNFQGTFVVTSGGTVSSARISHYCEGPHQFERIDTLDGKARHVFRHNQVVHTVWPQSRTVLIEQRDTRNSFPGLLSSGGDRIVEFYDVRVEGVERMAGHEANVLLLQPRDAYRYGYRLWSEKTSGLLLRADVLGERSEVLESSAFSEVSIGVKPQPDSVRQAMKKLDGYQVLRPAMTPTQLEAEGWTLRRPVAGFREVSCVKRPLDAVVEPGGRPAPTSAGGETLQTIYSDGLTYVSVFIEPFIAERHTRPMTAAIGATQTLMRRQGDWWITVVGDAPPATLRQFASGLERRP